MRFTPQFLDELRARLPVSEVVGKRVKLRKAGREWKGLSPFNKEKTPSFFVNDQKAMWFDFSSGRNGNIFDFVMLTEGVSFPEAVERLAGEAGVAVPVMTPAAEEREARRKTLYDIVELAAQFFAATLASRAGARGRGYLADRGIAPATQLKFRLGYAPAEQYALKEHLGAAKIPTADMVEAGLLVAGEDIPVPYDRFRDRVMFPITDWRGHVIAFGGRALEQGIAAKYLNSPETPLFHKGATLYNLAAAREAAYAGQSRPSAADNFSARVVAVEGYVDVIAMVSAGFAATVAPLGTALTAEQLALMWRMADEPILCFDGDEAGRRAAYRALDLALPLIRPGKSLKLATLPDGQDPDDLVRSGGREAVTDVLAVARPLGEMLWARESEAGPFDTPERRAALEARLAEVTAAIGDETVRRYYRQDFSARLRRLFAPADVASRRGQWDEHGRRRGAATPRLPPGAAAGRRDDAYLAASPQLAAAPLHRGHRAAIPRREALILQAALNHPWLLRDRLEELAEIEFRHADIGKLKAALIDILADHFGNEVARDGGDETAERTELAAALARRGFAELLARIERAITTPSVWGTQPQAAAADVLQTWRQLLALHRQWHSLTRELKEAELALGEDNTEANYARLRDVKARLSTLDGTEALIEGFGASSGRPARSL